MFSQLLRVLVELVDLFFLGFKGNNFANRSFHFRYSMEDLSKKWGKLSLTEKEKEGYVLPKTQRKYEFMIAAKFLNS